MRTHKAQMMKSLKGSVAFVCLAAVLAAPSYAMAGWEPNILRKQEKLEQAQAKIRELESEIESLKQKNGEQYKLQIQNLQQENKHLTLALNQNSKLTCESSGEILTLKKKNRALQQELGQTTASLEKEFGAKIQKLDEENQYLFELTVYGQGDASELEPTHEDIKQAHRITALEIENQDLKARLALLNSRQNSMLFKEREDDIALEKFIQKVGEKNDQGTDKYENTNIASIKGENFASITPGAGESHDKNQGKEEKKTISVLSVKATVKNNSALSGKQN